MTGSAYRAAQSKQSSAERNEDATDNTVDPPRNARPDQEEPGATGDAGVAQQGDERQNHEDAGEHEKLRQQRGVGIDELRKKRSEEQDRFRICGCDKEGLPV